MYGGNCAARTGANVQPRMLKAIAPEAQRIADQSARFINRNMDNVSNADASDRWTALADASRGKPCALPLSLFARNQADLFQGGPWSPNESESPIGSDLDL